MKLTRWILAMALVTGFAAEARPIRLPRHPDVNGQTIVFSYLGDLWIVGLEGGRAARLTSHPASETHPHFSPDGKWIGFTSNRSGNDDVFVMPAAGGEPRQLTFHSAADTVVGFSRDGRRVLFSSTRGRVFPGIPSLYEVSVDGGLEEALPADWGTYASYAPDGKTLVFNRHPIPWWRKHYRGSYAADLWTLDLATKRSRLLLDADLPDDQKPSNLWPMAGADSVWFVSDRATKAKAGSPEAMRSVSNIWKLPRGGGAPVQVTHHTSGSLFFPSLSSDGKTIVYEEDARLFRLDTATGQSREVPLDVESDGKESDPEIATYTDEADEFDLSPSTKRAVVSVRGELFTIATDKGDPARVTRGSARDHRAAFSPDGKRIAFVSDRSGRDEVWAVDEDGRNPKKLSDGDTEKLSLAWSPDSRAVAFIASDHKLWVVDVAAGVPRAVASSDVANLQTPDWSPDGRWLSYTKLDRDLRPHVHLAGAAGGEERRLSDDRLFASSGARFSPDGKTLYFLGGYSQGGSATLRSNVAALYRVSLAREERDPMSRDLDDEAAAEAAERDAKEKERDAKADRTKPKPEVKVDWDGLERRIHRITNLSDPISVAVPSPDGKLLAFLASGREEEARATQSLYVVKPSGEDLKRIAQHQIDEEAEPGRGGPDSGIGSPQFAKDGKAVFFRDGNGIASAPVEGESREGAASGSRGGRKKVSFTLRVEVSPRQEREQIFEEAWRIMKHRFYDAKMHGVDWERLKAQYRPLLAEAGDREEAQAIVLQMIGELNASHTGLSGGRDEREPVRTRFPGFEIVPDASGYYRIEHVYERGPADKDYAKVHNGQHVLAVEGMPLKSGENYYRLYNLIAGRKAELTLSEKPSPEGAFTVRVDTVTANGLGTLQYERWVEERRKMTEKLSGGEIGYLHIRAMNEASLRKFERDLADNRFKKGLIVDQRYNPGGGIDQELLQILGQRQYQYTRGRDSVYLTRPQRAYFGPVVVMQNERSTSDAEVFPAGFQRLGLGKTVGVTTYGAVIGTGAYRLVDGSTIRTPGTGLWDVKGQNLENYGVPPDVRVDNTPEDFLAGRDAQLEKAVSVLKDEIGKRGKEEIPGR